MRIRKRPHLSSSSSSPLSSSSSLVVSDPSLPLPPPQNGTREGLLKEREIGEGLHPDGDLTIEPHHGYFFLGEDPTKRGLKDPPLSTNPYPTIVVDPSHISTCCITTPNTTHVELLMKEVKDEKEGEKMVDSRRRWDAQVNSNKRIGSGSSSREKALSHRKEKEFKKEKKPMGRARANTTSLIDHCTADNGGDSKEGNSEGTKEEKGGVTANASAGKKRRSPAVLMEGSRCSRVNGRGWRCCQQTLVGYSLCEHHLGKGRLKSMSSVRGQLGVTAKSKRSASVKGGDGSVAASSSSQELLEKPKQQLSSEADNGKEVLFEEEAEGEEKAVRGSKKKKIGTVKARSISSLLDKTNGSHPTVSSTVSPPPSSPLLNII
uniref:WRC domain-containing protein n=1 Tax=Ananas comosus var. bracteatus TaxID=296719 RepID=A0A6V7P5W1_ANACO|nr:unnamed protein product [Ananas comosus var. bracteatus]